MALVRITQFTVNPADADEMLARRAALISAVRAAYPGLTEARLARVDEQTWIDIWRWDSAASLDAALSGVQAAPLRRRLGRSRSPRTPPPIRARSSTSDDSCVPTDEDPDATNV